MAFLKTSDSIIIRATLTEKGKKLLARGRFKVAKFALGDDEIDYELFSATRKNNSTYFPALLNTKLFEASKDKSKNLQFGLNSYDSGILYLTLNEQREISNRTPHAFVEYLPVLALNNKLDYSPTVRNDKYYVSINDETTKILNDGISNFKFLQADQHESVKIVVESGIQGSSEADFGGDNEYMRPTIENREQLILKKFLLDHDYFIYADNRFISNFVGITPSSKFENYSSGEKIITFNSSNMLTPISLSSEFEYYATYVAKGIPNRLFDRLSSTKDTLSSKLSALLGPRGSVVAVNPMIDNILKTNSTGKRDSRFVEFGNLNQIVFEELPSTKFDYIDTTIYIVGATSNARIQVPLRIIRYSGT